MARPRPVAPIAPAPASTAEVTPSTDLGREPTAPESSSATDPYAA
jgi:hypothetical protein